MTKSPTVQQAMRQFSILSNTINNMSAPGHSTHIWVMYVYPIIILLLLLMIKPSFIVEIDYTSHEKTISIRKLFTWMMLFYVPVIIYYIS
jgi:hypothetical protein